MHNNAQLPVLMDAFGYSTRHQTLQYVRIEEKESSERYGQLELDIGGTVKLPKNAQHDAF